MFRNRLTAGLLALSLLLAPLAACGGDDRGGKPAKNASSDSKVEKKSEAADTEDVTAFVEKLTSAMASKRTAKLEIELGSSMSATADVDYAETGTSMALRMITGTQTVRLVLARGTMYLQQTKGAKYLKIGKDDPALGALLDQVSSIGPKSALEKLAPAIKALRDLGQETVDGEELHHYGLTVDPSKVTSLFGGPSGTSAEKKPLTYGVWVDDDFLLRRVEMTVSGQKLVMKASDWGKPVNIRVPPASQVVTR